MPALIRILKPDGLYPAPYAADSLADAARHEPDEGIYTVTNTYEQFKVLKLEAHLDRMEDSARRAQIALQLNRPRLRKALRELIAEADYGDVRFRVTVGKDEPDAFILSVEPFTPPSGALISQGVRVISAANSARHNAAAKTTDWMHSRQALADAMLPGIYDTFLLDAAGNIMEGLSSNAYVIQDGVLRTAGSGVLPGIAQQIVFEIAESILPLRRDAARIADLALFEEAFLTSSSRGIIPVVEIDGHSLGDGTPGPLTRALRQAYDEWVARHLESL